MPAPRPLAAEPVVTAAPDLAETGRSEGGPPPSSSLGRLLLRFQPIWRGATEGLLAGAVVRMVRADDATARPVTLDKLLALNVEQPGAPAQRLLRRLTTLQANWRTLELPRVPLMLSVPESLLGFEPAGDFWSEALSDHESEAGELVLCVARLPELGPEAWPVRWAVADPPGRDGTACYCLGTGGDAGPAAKDEHNGQTRFTLPSADSVDGAQPTLSPRAFARLMSRSELAPF